MRELKMNIAWDAVLIAEDKDLWQGQPDRFRHSLDDSSIEKLARVWVIQYLVNRGDSKKHSIT